MKILYLLLSTVLLIPGTSSDNPASTQVYNFNYENVLGTSFTLKVVALSESAASEAEAAALCEIDRLSKILNTYDSESEFSQWQNTYNSDVKVSQELFEVMSLFEEWQSKTSGALNPAVGIAIDLWKKADITDILPDQERISKVVDVLNKNHWILNEENMTARHLTSDPLVFNTFVKSYIISKVSDEVIKTDGINSCLVNIGGDMVAAGEMDEIIGIADPERSSDNNDPVSTIEISGKAVATSGNYKRGFMIGDEWYSHIIDARTGIPAKDVISATVVSGKAAEAGALATAFNILTPEESITLAEQIPGLEFLIIGRDGSQIRSEGWEKLEVKTYNKTDHSDIKTDLELHIEFELSLFQGRSRRPYVAVWVENEQSEPVRTLALWFNDNRWLPDLKRWYAKNYKNTQQYDFMQSITSATRSAGKYILDWDLMDDNGSTVKPGKYTIYIEATREHGTYQLTKKDIDLDKYPQIIDMGGGIEVASAIINYHKAAEN